MDYYSEQLVKKQADLRDYVLRVGICIMAAIVVFLSILGLIMFNFPFIIVIGIGACYLAYQLIGATSVEYEYIVTNNDLDIDKISGKRKRKRLITVKLNSVSEWGEYEENKGRDVSATVIASDASGTGMWYLVAKHEKYGKVSVIFSPDEKTVININHGVSYSLRKKDLAKEKAEAEG